MSDVTKLLTTIVSKCAEYRNTFSENTAYIVDDFLERNPDSTVVLVGVYNFFQQNDLSKYSLNLSEDSMQLVMNALTLEMAKINSCLRNLADASPNIIYVDTMGTQTYEAIYDESGNVVSISGDEIHPSIEGHSSIARRILAALPDEIGAKKNYDIYVDLYGSCGKNDKITAVLVNDILYTDYEKDGYALTIHCKTPLVTSVTVFTKGEKMGVNAWQCSWNCSDGYRTYSMWKISDLKKSVLLPLANIKSAFQDAFGKVKPLFFR